jgi:hypothetical protein
VLTRRVRGVFAAATFVDPSLSIFLRAVASDVIAVAPPKHLSGTLATRSREIWERAKTAAASFSHVLELTSVGSPLNATQGTDAA